jgi:hypothetical protein
MRWFSLVVMSVVTVFAGVACGGDPAPKEASEETTRAEETTENKEQGYGDEASVDCQLDKAEADLGAEGAEELVNQWYEQDFSSALENAKDLHTFLAERGYTC